MKYNIPQVKQIDDTSCASADYTMVANALGLPYSLKDILKVTKSEIGFAPFWRFLVEKNNVEVLDFSENNYLTWAEDGFSRFEKDINPKTFTFLKDRIAYPDEYQADFKYLLASKNFKFHQQKPTVALLKDFFSKDYVCDVMLDPWAIYGEEPPYYSLHRVVILDINGDEVIFHDPSFDGEAFYKSDTTKFEKSFQIEGAELTCYKRI